MKKIVEEFKFRSGQVPGGMYAGITFIPGDPNKPWEEGEDSISSCPACDGVMRNLYQDSDLIVDGENRRYYKQVCKDCNYLNDTGMVMTAKEVKEKHEHTMES